MRILECEYICERCGNEIEDDERYPSICKGLKRSMLIMKEMFRYSTTVNMCGKCKASFVSWWNKEEGADCESTSEIKETET